MIGKFLAVSASLALAAAALPSSVAAQASSYAPGDYWDVTMVQVTPGQSETYTDWLAGEWKKNQDFAKAKGWIVEYHVLANGYSRPGEADIYVLTRYKTVPSAAEQIARQKEYEAYVQKDSRRMEKESGDRGSFRKVLGYMQFQELLLK
ncbi:hypothetical protein ACFB49_38190 [Sphingomonas sp. DBB INV C78]|uniref:hypothetical protein n=1 Tax=Sphingomonas sp. DBB INV C78 TaxID=3349434 RepID=UPI0036D24372